MAFQSTENTTERELDYPSALVLSIWYVLMSVIGIPLNMFIILSTVLHKSLRAVPMNWFVMNSALADFAYLLSAVLFLSWSVFSDQIACKISGFGLYYFGMISIVTAPFLAGIRFLTLSDHHLVINIYSLRGVICVNFCIWIAAAVIYSPFIFLNKLGLERVGMCGITHTGNWYETPYFICCIGILFVAYAATFYFNRRLHSWVTNMNKKLLLLTIESKVTLRDTRNLLKIFKWFLILPVVAFLPTAVLQICYRLDIQLLNIRVDRLVLTLCGLSPVVNAYVTIRYLKPYRSVLESLVSNKRFIGPFVQFIFKEDPNSETNWDKIKANVKTKVQAVYRFSMPTMVMRTNSVNVEHNSSDNNTLPPIDA